MAFATVVFPCTIINFKPLSSSRPTETNPNKHRTSTKIPKTQKLKPRKEKPPPPLPLVFSTGDGGDATTFTRLPPKDDFVLDDLASTSLTQVIKLSESNTADSGTNKFVQNLENGINVKEVTGEFDDMNDEKPGFDYGRFQLYEVGSDDDFDEDEEGLIASISEGSEIVEEGEDDEEIKEKDKGLPAVMRCFDRTKIFVKAGDGGNGVVAFRREKFVPLGGPSGGDGGRGGNVYMEVDGTMNSLLPFRKSLHYRAGRGSHGQGKQKSGAKGEDAVIKVPPGTVVRDSGGDVLLELLHPGQRALLLPGGRGGRGNSSFKSGMNKVPRIAENGEEGLEM